MQFTEDQIAFRDTLKRFIDKEVVPKERVRLAAEERTDEHTVSEELRKERVETDGDARA